ncbi:MAG: nucleotidyltransferase domain-containing protein [Bacteroidales bacterium]|nr:nucleotidyltransferase domain-containing protein [Candidatus Scybalocola fimicaballi]
MNHDKEIELGLYRIAKQNSKVARFILFGSRARGNARSDSDWDILVIINTDKIRNEDYNRFADPFYDLGLEYDAVINPILRTSEEWSKFSYLPLFQNIQREGIEIC